MVIIRLPVLNSRLYEQLPFGVVIPLLAGDPLDEPFGTHIP